MRNKEDKNLATLTESASPVSCMVESIVGCKWSLQVLENIRKGICRPGEIERNSPGLSTKVLNERLRKLLRFGILHRVSYPQIPPHVEYHFTRFGKRFLQIIEQVEKLQNELQEGQWPVEEVDR